MWFLLALLSAIFAALTSIQAKVGIDGVNSNLATAIRTEVVVAMAWGWYFLRMRRAELLKLVERVGFFSYYPVWQRVNGAKFQLILRTAQQKSFGLLIGIQLKRAGLPMRRSGIFYHCRLMLLQNICSSPLSRHLYLESLQQL